MVHDNEFNTLTIRDLADDETRLVIFFGDTYLDTKNSNKLFSNVVFAGIVSSDILAKQKILAMEPEHIRVKYLGNIDEEQAQHNLNDLIKDTKIDSVDIFSNTYSVKSVFELLENYNEFKGKDIINIDNSCMINVKDTTGINADLIDIISKALGIRGLLEDDMSWTSAYTSDILLSNLDGCCRIKIDRFRADNIMDKRIENGILKAICLRSLYKAERTFGIVSNNSFTLTDVPATVVHRLYTEKRNIKYTEIAYLIGMYDMHRTDVIGTYKCKVSRYSIRDLFFTFIEEWFRFCDAEEMKKKTVDLEYVATNELSGIFVYSIDTLIEIMTDLYNKGIYVSIDVNRKDIAYYNIDNENGLMMPKQLSHNIEVDSLVTANVLLDIDTEIEEAIKKLRQAARIEFNKEKER